MAFDHFRGRALSFKTTSVETDISVSQWHRLASAGKIKVVKLGYRMSRIDGDSLADFLTSCLDQDRKPRGKAAKKHTPIELAGQG